LHKYERDRTETVKSEENYSPVVNRVRIQKVIEENFNWTKNAALADNSNRMSEISPERRELVSHRKSTMATLMMFSGLKSTKM
jgi:hypothetical protein